MPVYCYKCNNCNEEFEIKHSMSFEEQKCLFCNSEDIFKVPSLSIIEKNYNRTTSKAGTVVDKYIKDAKEELKKEKISLKERDL